MLLRAGYTLGNDYPCINGSEYGDPNTFLLYVSGDWSGVAFDYDLTISVNGEVGGYYITGYTHTVMHPDYYRCTISPALRTKDVVSIRPAWFNSEIGGETSFTVP